MHTTINHQVITFFPSKAKADELAVSLISDDPDTDYRVVGASKGFFVAIFEDGTQVYTI
jgi:hypothetical protein